MKYANRRAAAANETFAGRCAMEPQRSSLTLRA
jgi:hypothetical protein